MVKVTDEVLAFDLEQPRHATSMQVFPFLQTTARISRRGICLYHFDPSECPRSSPGRCHRLTLSAWYTSSKYAPPSTPHPKFQKIREKETNMRKPLRSHTGTVPIFFPSCHDTGIVQNCSRRGKPIYISASMKGKNKSNTCIKYIHESAFEVIQQMKNCHVSSQTPPPLFQFPQ